MSEEPQNADGYTLQRLIKDIAKLMAEPI